MSRRSSVHEAFLQNIPLAVVVDNENPMSSIDINSTLKEALTKLCSQDSDALPVFDEKTGLYEYVASRLDIIGMVAWTTTDGWKSSPLLDVLESEQHVVDPRIFQFTMNDSVVSCLEPFSKGVHHILIKNEEYDDQETKQDIDDTDFIDEDSDTLVEQEFYWLSQFQIVQFLLNNMQRMSAIVDAPINKIGLVKEKNLKNEKIFTVDHKMLAKEAFKQFLVHRCDVIGIVNEKGELVSHISESDIIGVGPEAIHFLLHDEYLTVGDFMAAVNKENKRDAKHVPVCCKKDQILRNLVKIVVERRSNHIFIVDDNKKPIKLVTLNDLICKFSPYDYKTNKISKKLSVVAAGNAKKLLSAIKETTKIAESDNNNSSSNTD